jgi:hypothetical protein
MFKITRRLNLNHVEKLKKFTQTTQSNFGKKFSTVDAIAQTANHSLNFEILHVNLQKQKISVESPKEKTLKDLEQIIKKGNKFTTVEFKTWDDSIISKNNNLAMLFERNEPIFMRINSMEWQLLNLGEFNYTTVENFRVKEDFSHNAKDELKEIIEKIKNFSHNTTDLKDEEISKIAWQLFKIKNFYQGKDYKSFLSQFKNLSEILEKFYDLKSEYNSLHQLKEKLLQKCQFKSKVLLLLAGILFILELILIYYGTFIQFSWDIVEPVTYLIGCSNIILVLYYRKKMGALSPHQFYTQKFFNNLVRKKNFDQMHFEEVGRRLKEIEKVLNK